LFVFDVKPAVESRNVADLLLEEKKSRARVMRTTDMRKMREYVTDSSCITSELALATPQRPPSERRVLLRPQSIAVVSVVYRQLPVAVSMSSTYESPGGNDRSSNMRAVVTMWMSVTANCVGDRKQLSG
jgi:hypothetical protein